MMQQEIKDRTKKIAVSVIKLVDELPNKVSIWELSRQVIRSACSIGSNYRAACRAKSDADFINKLKIVEEETDETYYWIELLEESGILLSTRVEWLKKELNEILSIIVASLKTLRAKMITKKSTV